MSERVRVEIKEGVAHVRLNRPEKRNGLDLPLFEALVEAGLRLRDDRSVRAVVLSGEGEAFSAGLDFAGFIARGEERALPLERPKESPANLAQRVAWIWQELPVPVIAAVHGVAFGGGLQIALGADLRYVHPDARLSVMEKEPPRHPRRQAAPRRVPRARRPRLAAARDRAAAHAPREPKPEGGRRGQDAETRPSLQGSRVSKRR